MVVYHEAYPELHSLKPNPTSPSLWFSAVVCNPWVKRPGSSLGLFQDLHAVMLKTPSWHAKMRSHVLKYLHFGIRQRANPLSISDLGAHIA